MANKKEKEKRARENVALQYKKSAGKLLPFYGWAIAVSLVVVICYFLNWVYVYNSDYGVEVKASGFSFISAASADNYSSADKIYGDLAMPFYYYAKASCETLGAVTLTAFKRFCRCRSLGGKNVEIAGIVFRIRCVFVCFFRSACGCFRRRARYEKR